MALVKPRNLRGKPCRNGLPYGNHTKGVFRTFWLGLDPTVVSPGVIWDTRGPVATEPKTRLRLEIGLSGEVCRTGIDPNRTFATAGGSLQRHGRSSKQGCPALTRRNVTSP
jgi:hypothetical protein